MLGGWGLPPRATRVVSLKETFLVMRYDSLHVLRLAPRLPILQREKRDAPRPVNEARVGQTDERLGVALRLKITDELNHDVLFSRT